jgi:hypothetical protein
MVLEPAVQTAFDDLDAAIDYGLLGLRVHAVAFSRFPMMGRAYEDMAGLVDDLPMHSGPWLTAFRDRMKAHQSQLKTTYLAHEDWRLSREAAYAEIYRQCGRGVVTCGDGPDLPLLLAPVRRPFGCKRGVRSRGRLPVAEFTAAGQRVPSAQSVRSSFEFDNFRFIRRGSADAVSGRDTLILWRPDLTVDRHETPGSE